MDRQIHIPGAVRDGGSPILIPESARAKGLWRLDIYDAKRLTSGRDSRAALPREVQEFYNLLANTGGALAIDLLIGAGGTTFANANAYIGIGSGNTAVSAGHTDLQGASKTRKAMESTFPSRAGQILTFKSVFGTGDANYSWEEIAAFNASSAGTMLNRALVTAPFTKTSSLSITATLTWTLA
jgi:hypothetical protein